ncbi:S41 family peptidase [candidate division KSB1 bacterium]|nr:S41 family peptidase [candidate division KSB1 bacterium]
MRKIKKSTAIWSLIIIVFFVLAFNFSYSILFSADNAFQQMARFMEVYKIVRSYYVESVDTEKLMTGAIQGMLEELDPHSVYIEPKKLKEITEQFQGAYQGIGIEFIIQNKVITVVSPIAGSPSEALGLKPGDQIIKIEGKSAYGITESDVQKKLKGRKGTKVTVTIRRPGMHDPFDVTITRDEIPIYSVMANFIIQEKIGYIYVGRFAQKTVDEFDKAVRELDEQGMEALLLDLRGNAGGYLDQAFKMADRFIDGNKKIVYTKGRIPNSNTEFLATHRATHKKMPLIILIDKGSASASEIVAGAVQDWDRGLIVGETSFGKGLVQTQMPLKDGSALRITTARYYTPSGRLIQRSYEDGLMDYYASVYQDDDVEEPVKDSEDKPVFYTEAGREVYGGGGITPDIKIKHGTITKQTTEIVFKRLFFEFGSQYATKHSHLKNNFDSFKDNFFVDKPILQNFKSFIESKDVSLADKDFKKDLKYIKLMIKAEIARNLWSSRQYYQVRISGDKMVQGALQHFGKAAKVAGLNWVSDKRASNDRKL